MKKIVINVCFGGFSLSNKAIKRYLELKGKECHTYKNDFSNKIFTKISDDNDLFCPFTFTKDFGDEFEEPEWKDKKGVKTKEYKKVWDYHFSSNDVKRDDSILIKVIKELGKKADGKCAKLSIVEIPDDVEWEIEEYDGVEKVVEKHRSWE